jgi:GMP synthase (glutamine-hydrolysing)
VLYTCAPQTITHLSITPGDLNAARTKTLQTADLLAMTWLKEIGQDRAVWQMPTVLLPLAVNMPGKESLVLRPIVSEEAMTAHFAQLPMDSLALLTGALLQDSQISGVFYDVTNKPPATIEWE